jgi:hypothetical protein
LILSALAGLKSKIWQKAFFILFSIVIELSTDPTLPDLPHDQQLVRPQGMVYMQLQGI